MSVVAIIPARGGSERLPGKNIKDFWGKPIIAYSIELARDSGMFSAVVVTTDDKAIADVALEYGAFVVMRPPDDGSKGTQEVAGDLLRSMPGVKEACVIYATAPLATVDDLKAAKSAHGGRDFAMTVGTEPLCDAGAIYWGKAESFVQGVPLLAPNTALVPLPPERVCDINTEEDFEEAKKKYAALYPDVKEKTKP